MHKDLSNTELLFNLVTNNIVAPEIVEYFSFLLEHNLDKFLDITKLNNPNHIESVLIRKHAVNRAWKHAPKYDKLRYAAMEMYLGRSASPIEKDEPIPERAVPEYPWIAKYLSFLQAYGICKDYSYSDFEKEPAFLPTLIKETRMTGHTVWEKVYTVLGERASEEYLNKVMADLEIQDLHIEDAEDKRTEAFVRTIIDWVGVPIEIIERAEALSNKAVGEVTETNYAELLNHWSILAFSLIVRKKRAIKLYQSVISCHEPQSPGAGT